MSQMVMFRVGRSRYALPVDLVTEVIESPAIEPSPWTGDAILGVSRVRGHWIPVVRICNEETEAEAPIWEE